MKRTYVIAAAVIGVALAAPVFAHHNCAAGDACPEEIGDAMGMHEAAIDGLGDTDMGGQMDPVDDSAGVDPTQDGFAADSAGDQPNDTQSRTNSAIPDDPLDEPPGGTQDRNWSGQ